MERETGTHPKPRHQIAYETAMQKGEFNRYSKGTLIVILEDEFVGTGKDITEVMQLPQVRDPNRKKSFVIYTWDDPRVSVQAHRNISR